MKPHLADLRHGSNSINSESGETNLNGFQTNTVGTINMLGLAKRTKARILIASTSEVICTVKTSHRSLMIHKKFLHNILDAQFNCTTHCWSLLFKEREDFHGTPGLKLKHSNH